MTADLDFGGYKVSNQAYSAYQTFEHGTKAHDTTVQANGSSSQPAGQGLIGLGPNTGSNVWQKFQSDEVASVCLRIFLQNTSTPNFISVNLGRLDGVYLQTNLAGSRLKIDINP